MMTSAHAVRHYLSHIVPQLLYMPKLFVVCLSMHITGNQLVNTRRLLSTPDAHWLIH
jgi:hypothetical protein